MQNLVTRFGLIAALISIALIGGATLVGKSVNARFIEVGEKMTGATIE